MNLLTDTEQIKTTKFPCRRSGSDRRISAKTPDFPMTDAGGARINNDRRRSPDRRYNVEIQWLRG